MNTMLFPLIALLAAPAVPGACQEETRAQEKHDTKHEERLERVSQADRERKTDEEVQAKRERAEAAQKERFDRDAWSEKLAQPDLERRERAFQRMVERAREDDAAREAIEEWSRGTGELAWTARLAQRELERSGRVTARGNPQRFPGMEDIEERMRELEKRFSDPDMSWWTWDPNTAQGFVPPQGRSRSKQMRIEVGPDGARIEVDEDVDGKRETKTYEGESLEEIYEVHPELRDSVRIEMGGGPRRLQGPIKLERELLRAAPNDPDQRWARPARPLGGSNGVRTDILGVNYREPSAQERERAGLAEGEGIVVQNVVDGTIAAAVGVEPGDTIVALNGRKIASREDVLAALEARRASEELRVELVDGDGRHRTLTWAPRPQQTW